MKILEEVKATRSQFEFCEMVLDAVYLVLECRADSVRQSELPEALQNLQLVKSLMDGNICTRANDIVQEANELLRKVDRIYSERSEPLDFAA